MQEVDQTLSRPSTFGPRSLTALGLVVAITACDPTRPVEPEAGPRVPVASVRVTPQSLILERGETQQLSATLGDAAGNMLPSRPSAPTLLSEGAALTIADATGRSGRVVTWTSSEPARVSVDLNGSINALAVGEATVTATSEERSGTARVIVTQPSAAPIAVTPAGATLSVGATLKLTAGARDGAGEAPNARLRWESDQPSRAAVDSSGLVTATGAGSVTIMAASGERRGSATLTIMPAPTIHGVDFPGSAGVSTTTRFEFTSPLPAYPATYIWRAYPRQQQSYYTAFFWGNSGSFHPSNTYYGFHPYPDWDTDYQHFWEIAAPPGQDVVSSSHVVYDRWYVQVAVCRVVDETIMHEFYWDWPDTTKVVRHTGARVGDPPTPTLVVGDAPWNPGNEVWDGVLRGFQFYDTALTESEIAREVASPGSVRTPWYLNLNPTPSDIGDKSGNAHHPGWVGAERPSSWTGTLVGGTTIRTVVAPR